MVRANLKNNVGANLRVRPMIMLIIGLLVVSCGGGNNTPSTSQNENNTQGGNNYGGKQLITKNKKTGEGSEARDYYYADTSREEFTFDKSGTLIDYKRIYTFVDGADKEKALEYITMAGFKASIEGNTLVVDGDGYFLSYSYAESNFDEIKERLDGKGTEYTVK